MMELSAQRALAVMDRMWHEAPSDFEEFMEWCAQPRHTQTIKLEFRNGRFVFARLETTSERKSA
jgi:hypothetical protein